MEKFLVKKDAHLFTTSLPFEFTLHLSFNTEKSPSSKNNNPSKKVTSGEKMIRIKSIFKRKSGSKSSLIAIKNSLTHLLLQNFT